jgi:hypothetical protein
MQNVLGINDIHILCNLENPNHIYIIFNNVNVTETNNNDPGGIIYNCVIYKSVDFNGYNIDYYSNLNKNSLSISTLTGDDLLISTNNTSTYTVNSY